jgi:NADH:ubiquinone oxidoreductase subunit 4 (subunit M)
LPEAHVEAPTIGSIILAGILLKVGSFAISKYLIPLCPNAMYFFSPLLVTVSTIGIFYTGLMTVRQVDLKKIIAYASVTHMNYILLGLTMPTLLAYTGAIYLMVGHAVVSTALFFLIGCLYERYHTRIIFYYSGLVNYMPNFVLFFFLFTLGNISFPSTSNFIGELLIVSALIKTNLLVSVIAIFSLFITVSYSVWLFNRLAFGAVLQYPSSDLSKREYIICLFLTVCMFILGLVPSPLITALEYAISKLVVIAT